MRSPRSATGSWRRASRRVEADVLPPGLISTARRRLQMTAPERKDGGARSAPPAANASGERALLRRLRTAVGTARRGREEPSASSSPASSCWRSFLVAGLFDAGSTSCNLDRRERARAAAARRRARARARVRSAGAGGGTAGEMPSDHPPVGHPGRGQAVRGPARREGQGAHRRTPAAWKSLAQVQARAEEMDPSYGAQALESWQHVLSPRPRRRRRGARHRQRLLRPAAVRSRCRAV